MGFTIENNRVFVSELSPAEIKDCRARALWFAETYFPSKETEAFDLGNIFGKYMTAKVYTCSVPWQQRICYYVGSELVRTERIQIDQNARGKAVEYYLAQVAKVRQKENERRALKQVERVVL